MSTLQAERRRTQGTPVTPESFNAWRLKFNKERQAKKKIQDEEKMREMTNKEKEEFKKYASRLTGESFERHGPPLAMAARLLRLGVHSGLQAVNSLSAIEISQPRTILLRKKTPSRLTFLSITGRKLRRRKMKNGCISATAIDLAPPV